MFKKKEKKEKDISALQVLRNCLFCASELFKYSKSFLIYNFIAYFVFEAIYTFESTYYMKWLVSALENRSPFSVIVTLVCIFVGLQIVVMLFDQYLFVYWHSIVSNRFTQYFNKLIFKKAGNVELECYEDPEFFDKYTNALDKTPERIISVTESFAGIIASIGSVSVFLAVMLSIDRGVALFLIFPMIGNFALGGYLNKIEQKRYKENTKSVRIIDYVKRVLHFNQYAKELRITDIYTLMRRQHRSAVENICGVYDKYALKTSVVYWFKVMFTFTLIFEGILAYCAYCALVKRTMVLSELTIMTTLMTSASWSIIGLFGTLNELHNESIYIQNARDFLLYKEKIAEDGEGLEVPSNVQEIEFRNVSFSYKGADEKAIDNLSLKIPIGKKIALVGHNGAGKSTLIKLLLRLYDADEGEILLDGVNIKQYSLRSYRNLFSAAFQDYQVIAMSVLDNLTMGREIENAEKLGEELIDAVGLSERIAKMPEGIHNTLTREFDDSGAVLSGGESQKLAVARALMQNGRYMIFDEPSAALDPIAEFELFETILERTKESAVVLISHRLSSVKSADTIYMLENGSVIEEGNHAFLMQRGGRYAEMFRLQAKNYLAFENEGGGAL